MRGRPPALIEKRFVGGGAKRAEAYGAAAVRCRHLLKIFVFFKAHGVREPCAPRVAREREFGYDEEPIGERGPMLRSGRTRCKREAAVDDRSLIHRRDV